MKKIIIYPHFCSREEYAELIEYLDQKSWDFKEVDTNDKTKPDAMEWWSNLASNPLLSMLKQGDLVTKYYGNRIPSSLKDSEIEFIWFNETKSW